MKEFSVEAYLNALYQRLLQAASQKIELTADWCQRFPQKPGVYLFRDQTKIIYVGESGNISARMDDLRRTVNHTLRRNIGNNIFSHVEGWSKATSKKRFIDTIEEMLNDHFRMNLTVATLPVPLGRCELEEMVITKHQPEYNRKGKRDAE